MAFRSDMAGLNMQVCGGANMDDCRAVAITFITAASRLIFDITAPVYEAGAARYVICVTYVNL